jgi:hypothetical protein
MQETPESGTDSTDRCSAIIDVSILSTSGEHQKQNKRQGQKTGSKRAESGTSVSSAKREPPPRFLVTDLNRLTFRIGESAYQADDTDHTPEWAQFVGEHANVARVIDWSDLEERVHFLNMLFAYCSAKGKPFPLAALPGEKFNEKA